MATKILLLTGEPGNYLSIFNFLITFWIQKGIGKTTLMKDVIIKLKNADVKNIKGFITEEIRNQIFTRNGFDVVDLCNEENRGSLARIS